MFTIGLELGGGLERKGIGTRAGLGQAEGSDLRLGGDEIGWFSRAFDN